MTALRVLVIEDDFMIGTLLGEMLSEMGHEVCSIEATEDDAVNAASRHKPDLMIVDAWLRTGNGLSAVEKICRSGAVPHLFVSGDVLRVSVLRPDAIVIKKPYRETDLANAIERAIGSTIAA